MSTKLRTISHLSQYVFALPTLVGRRTKTSSSRLTKLLLLMSSQYYEAQAERGFFLWRSLQHLLAVLSGDPEVV